MTLENTLKKTLSALKSKPNTCFLTEQNALNDQNTPCAEIAERMRIEHQLRKDKIAAEENVRNYATFLANNAHDVRTHLNVIMGYADMFREGLHISNHEDYTETYAKTIHKASEHLLTLINQLLTVSQIDVEKLELREQLTTVKTFIDNAADMVRERAKNANIDFFVTVDDGLPLILINQQRLSQAISNLLSNAIKFTPRGGRIDLLAYKNLQEQLEIHISDNGIGMNEECISHALSEFGHIGTDQNNVEYLDKTTTHSTPGLGLPLAKRLIELHGGTLELQSELGRGTTLILKLPSQRWHIQHQ